MAKFNPSAPTSVEAATLLKVADLIADCEPFQQLSDKTTSADARTKIKTGPFPLAWEGSGFTKQQLADLLCSVNLHPPMQGDKSVVLDSGSFVAPRESGTFVMTTRRYVRESEYEEDGNGNDIYMFFLDRIAALEAEMIRRSDLEAATNSDYPHPLSIQRVDGPAFGKLAEKPAQGEYLWARHSIGWGLSPEQ